jgi:hypothetical protein
MIVAKLIAELQKLENPLGTVYASFDSDNAAGIVEEVYITSEGDCAKGMLKTQRIVLRIY